MQIKLQIKQKNQEQINYTLKYVMKIYSENKLQFQRAEAGKALM